MHLSSDWLIGRLWLDDDQVFVHARGMQDCLDDDETDITASASAPTTSRYDRLRSMEKRRYAHARSLPAVTMSRLDQTKGQEDCATMTTRRLKLTQAFYQL